MQSFTSLESPIPEVDDEDSQIDIMESAPKQRLEDLELEIKEATRVLTTLQDKFQRAGGRPYKL